MPTLFDELVTVAARTLGQSVAPFTLGRLLLRARVYERDAITPDQVRRALPVLESGFREFLTPVELRATMQGLEHVLAQHEQPSGHEFTRTPHH